MFSGILLLEQLVNLLALLGIMRFIQFREMILPIIICILKGLMLLLAILTFVRISLLLRALQLMPFVLRFKLKMYERDARGGTRYQEVVLAHFGVMGDDARLQRPEYLGGGTAPIMLTPVPQTSVTSGSSATGRLSAAGVVSASGHGFVKSFTEHCLILGLVCVTADLTYQQGLDRKWSRLTRLDHYWPALSNIGEQAVL